MTRLLTCGWETNDVNEVGTNTIGASSTMTLVNTNPTPRGANWCIKMLATNTTGNIVYKTISIPSRIDIWVRFAFFAHGYTAEYQIAGINDTNGTTITALTFSSTGVFRAYNGSIQNAVIGQSPGAYAQDGWHVVEWHHQMTSTVQGITEVWINGNQVISFSGDNTYSGSLLATGALTLGQYVSNYATGQYTAYDDLAVNDTNGTINNGRPGDGRVVLLTPNGAGSATALSRGGTDTGANWSQTSELPPSMTQYVTSSTVAARDLYAMSDLTGTVTVNVVEAIALAQNSDVGAGSVGLTVQSGATVNEATAVSLGTTAGYVVARWETDPNTSAAWTQAAVNALQAGVTVR